MWALTDEYRRQAERLSFTAHLRSECHVAAARVFSNVHLALGALAAGLAAGAGGTAFAGNGDLAGWLGIAAATITGLLTALRPDERSQQHWKAAGEYVRVMEHAYVSYLAPASGDGSNPTVEPPSITASTREDPPSVLGAAVPGQAKEPEAFSGDGSASEHPLGRLFDDFQRLEVIGPPVPRYLAGRAEGSIRRQREWFPPQYESFGGWRSRRAPPVPSASDYE